MAKKNLILLSLEDKKINKIANVISNESCKKILDFLASKEYATESEIADKLSLPISTIHYNLKQLMDSGLVNADEFHYSKKGREVNRYKLANKYIIIAPKKTKTSGLKQKLKNILPVALITAGAAGLIQLTTNFIQKPTSVMGKASMQAFDAATEMAESSVRAVPVAAEAAEKALQTHLWQNIALWFFLGAVFAIIVYLILSYFKKENS
ncbi:helix-turn-helix domain-containing protein [Candidatus Woesearchaeota archaeon]|nr:helix-turn-helix domain-containing protein [Candidatus Woesearchaeota archaeon]